MRPVPAPRSRTRAVRGLSDARHTASRMASGTPSGQPRYWSNVDASASKSGIVVARTSLPVPLGLHRKQLRVQAMAREQFLVGTLFHDRAVAENHDPVGHARS